MKGKSIQEKTNSILDFITDTRVLNVLYEVMFKFKKVQDQIGLKNKSQANYNMDLEMIRDKFIEDVK